MVIVAVVLIAIAAVLTAAAVTSNGHHVTFDLWSIVDSKISVGVVFVAGMITTVIAVAGVVLLTSGVKRAHRNRKERKELNRQHESMSATPDFLTSMPDPNVLGGRSSTDTPPGGRPKRSP